MRKFPETPLGASSTGILHALDSLFQKKVFIHAWNKITIIDICDKQDSWRSASRFLINGSSSRRNRVYLDYKGDTFKIDNAMVYQIFSKVFTDGCFCLHETEESHAEQLSSVL